MEFQMNIELGQFLISISAPVTDCALVFARSKAQCAPVDTAPHCLETTPYTWRHAMHADDGVGWR